MKSHGFENRPSHFLGKRYDFRREMSFSGPAKSPFVFLIVGRENPWNSAKPVSFQK